MAVEKRKDGKPKKKKKKDDSFQEWFGLDVESMSPTAQVATGAIASALILGAIAMVFLLAPYLWWLVFVFGWAAFPAVGIFLRGVAGVLDSDSEVKPAAATDRERELLEALSNKGEMTPAQVAMETSLTVREADEMMKGLASDGHLDVRVHGGGIFYALWDYDRRDDSPS